MSQGREAIVKRGPGRPPRHSYAPFAFKTGDLVLVKWNDGMVYFAKIKRIDHKRQKCVVVFDDKSQDEAHFSQIHSGKDRTEYRGTRRIVKRTLVAPCVYGTIKIITKGGRQAQKQLSVSGCQNIKSAWEKIIVMLNLMRGHDGMLLLVGLHLLIK